MAIERKNSFHLLLSDDEHKLLNLLAEKEGLNASDYLRALVRRAANTPAPLVHMLRLQETMGKGFDLAGMWQMLAEARTSSLGGGTLQSAEPKAGKTVTAAKAKKKK